MTNRNGILRISLAETDPAACRRFIRCAADLDNMKIVSVSHTVEEAVTDILAAAPHAIILDLDLGGVREAGLDVLKRLQLGPKPPKPFVYLTVMNGQGGDLHRRAIPMGADYIQSKRQKDYSEKMALDMMDAARNTILSYA